MRLFGLLFIEKSNSDNVIVIIIIMIILDCTENERAKEIRKMLWEQKKEPKT
jgi:hypothetical protein